jgi:hypothetical protein
MRRAVFVAVPLLLSGSITSALAVEGGSGAYLLGSHGFMGGYVPPAGVYWSNDFVYIDASVAQLAIGGVAVTDAELSALVYKLNTTFIGEGTLFGGNAGININIPIVDAHLKFEGVLGGAIAGTLRDQEAGAGDITVTPLIGWHEGKWSYSASLSIFLPTGVYDTASIDVADRSIDVLSIGKNKFAFDPTGSVTYFDPTSGFEFSSSLGVTLNLRNEATDYLTAPELHLETTVAEHFSNNWIVGATGYYYQQLADDSGSGAEQFRRVTGAKSLQARVFGGGPVVQYSTKLDDVGLSVQLKYLHEFGALRRFESDVYWGTVSFAF